MRHIKGISIIILCFCALSIWIVQVGVHAKPVTSNTRVSKNTQPISTVKKIKLLQKNSNRPANQAPSSGRVRVGYIPADVYPMAEPVVVDYLDDEPSRMRERGELIGPYPMNFTTRGIVNGGGIAAGGCTHDIECDDGHPCTLDECDLIPGAQVGTGKCLNSLILDGDAGDCDDGVFCNGTETCQGQDDINPGICTSGTPPCNKSEVCDTFENACLAPCTNETVCNFVCIGGIAIADGTRCESAADCDGGECREDVCHPKTCNVDGLCEPLDNPCGPGGDCLIRFCGLGDGNGCTRLNGCRDSPCETDSDCRTIDGQIINNACQDGLLCYYGRCCTPDTDVGDEGNWDCNRSRKADCTGIWFAGDTGRVSGTFECNPNEGGCPKYSGGIAPLGDFLSLVGPISDSSQPVPNSFNQGIGPGTPLNKLGDDYQLTNHPSFIELEYVRIVGRINEPGDLLVEFYDESGFLVEDIIHTIDNTNLAIQLIRLSPPLTIPSKGFVVVRASSISTPNIRFEWATTDVPDVGTNNPDVLWVNDGLQGGPNASMSNFLLSPGVLALELVGTSKEKVSAPLGACCDSTLGTCSEKLGWVCKGEGNRFSGLGTICGVCSLDSTIFSGSSCRRCGGTVTGDPCAGDDDCVGSCAAVDSLCKSCGLDTVPVCSGDLITDCSDLGDLDCIGIGDGTCIQPGILCDNTSDCNGGTCAGTCITNTTCLTGACCDPIDYTGDGCTAGVLPTDCEGGLCDESSMEAGTFCMSDDECTGGLCNMFFQGFGHDCQPNCCRQPRDRWRNPEVEGPWSGGDNCEDAFVHAITVPPFGSDPITITISGDSSNATNTFENPDTCFGFSEDPNADRGWWEAISIDDCAFVWWDICCTSCEGGCNPGYLFMYNSCDPVSQSCPTKVNATGCLTFGDITHCYPSSRGLPFCEDNDNITVFFGPLEAGTYYIPFDARTQSVNGPYQMHVSVLPCPEAACCINNETNTESICSVLNQIECEEAGGYYLGPPNRSPAVTLCNPDLCDTGSCCTGPGQCVDLELGQEMTITSCSNDFGGNYSGGIKCFNGVCSSDPLRTCYVSDAGTIIGCPIGETCILTYLNDGQLDPCPVCDFATPNSCQMFDGSYHYNFLPSDLGMIGKITLADDFIPDSDTLGALCVWGFYLALYNANEADYIPDCANVVGLEGDKFRVRVYENTEDDLPGNLVGESFVSTLTKGVDGAGIALGCGDLFGPCIDTYGINMVLDTPISGMQVDGRTYWIEVVNDLSDIANCNWWQWQLIEDSTDGNNYSAVGSDGVYNPGSEATHAQAYCLDMNFTLPPEPTRPCCKCSDGTCNMMTLSECKNAAGQWDITQSICDNIICELGSPANDSCSAPIEIPSVPFRTVTNNFCADTDGYNPVFSDFGRDPLGSDIWYTYTPTINCDLTASMCASGVSYDSFMAMYSFGTGECPCPIDEKTHLNSFIEASDESCVGTPIGGGGFVETQAQVGVCYTIRVGGWAPGDSKGIGILDVSCRVFEPGPVLPDPDSPGGLACGSGPNYGLPCSTCSAGMRAGNLCTDSVDCGGETCVPTDALCDVGFTCGSNVAGVVISNPWPKNRYIGFMPPDTGRWKDKEIAIRVTLVDVPSNPKCNGEVRWAGPPSEFSESEGSLFKLQAAKLGTEPVFVDWNAIGLPIQIYGEEINPGSLYSIQAIDIAGSGALEVESIYSNGLLVKTATWGDVIKPLGAIGAVGQPNIDDVTAVVGKWLSQWKPVRAISHLQPQYVTPAADLTIDDVTQAINAWLGSPYPFSVDSCLP